MKKYVKISDDKVIACLMTDGEQPTGMIEVSEGVGLGFDYDAGADEFSAPAL